MIDLNKKVWQWFFGKEPKSFFDYSDSEKRKILKESAKESNRMQKELVKERKSFVDADKYIKAWNKCVEKLKEKTYYGDSVKKKKKR